MKKRAARPLSRVIADDEKLGEWQARHAREQALLETIRRHLPRQLGARLSAAELPSGEVELIAPAGAVAAAVRQRIPDLAIMLQREGWPCRGLRVRIQVREEVEPSRPRVIVSPARQDLAPLARLSGDLPAGPLKNALARLLRRTGGA